MNYNMMNGQNFQGQKYRENMQSNNMPYDQVMNTVSMMKFMREFMENKHNRMDNIAPRNYDNNQDYSQEFFRRMGNQGMRFKRQVNGNTKPHGSDATNLPGFLELGDRLAEKLKETKEHAIAKIGNFTCVMKDMNVLNDQTQIDVRSMKQELEKYNMPSQWFKNHEIRNIEICYQMSEAVPQSVQDEGFPAVLQGIQEAHMHVPGHEGQGREQLWTSRANFGADWTHRGRAVPPDAGAPLLQ